MRQPMWTIALAAALALGSVARTPAKAQSQTAQVLITPEEAALPGAPEEDLTMRGLTRGPGVEQISPDPAGQPVVGPVPLKVRFIARNQVPIDPASLRVTYMKANSVDVTARVKGFVTAGGIEMSRAAVPPGTHVLRVEVKDSQGRSGATTVKLVVAKP